MIPDILRARPRGPAPEKYQPLPGIIVCSNLLQSVKYIIEVGGSVHPILIGVGTRPRVWLASPTDAKRQEWKLVVDDNEAVHPAFHVKVGNGLIEVFASVTRVLQLEYGAGMPEITALDLRPIGLNVTGTAMGMTIGRTQLRQSRFANTNVAFSVD